MKEDELEKKLGVKLSQRDLLKEALTHRSYLNERPDWPHAHNERLEYLGDAVLELAVTDSLFRRFPQMPEGQLTVLRAALVNYQMLSRIALALGLEQHIYMSRGEARDTGKAREVILANAIEAVIGAIYLDAGMNAAFVLVRKFVVSHIDEVLEKKTYRDPKSELQEIVQEKMKLTPHYKVLDEHGPAHQKTFRVGVFFDGERAAEGTGSSKQEAETEAARAALEAYRK